MSRINQVLFSVAFICLVVWYGFYVNRLNLEAPERKIVVGEDSAMDIQLVSKGVKIENLEIEISKMPENGVLISNGKRFEYRPSKDFFGKDSFEYRFRSGERVGDPAAVKIEVYSVNDQPIAVGQVLEVEEDKQLDIRLVGQDIEKDFLTFSIIKNPLHGRLTGNPPILTYIPENDYHGEDFFEFTVHDGLIKSQAGTVNIKINPVNDVPLVENSVFKTNVSTPVKFQFKGFDKENNELAFLITKQPDHGKVVKVGKHHLFVPDSHFAGKDSMTFQAWDGEQRSQPGVVEFIVSGINHQAELGKVLEKVVDQGGIAIGDFDEPEYVYHTGQYVPASLLKLVTAAAAIEVLGEDFRFKTEFYFDEKRNLYIKGLGDPSLESRDWHAIGHVLNAQGIFKEDINRIVIDSTAFSNRLDIDGRRKTINYFDAPPSALPSNYNTIEVRIKSNKRISVLDEYTPLTSMIIKKARRLPPGYQHFSVAFDAKESLRYSAELAAAIFSEYGATYENKPVMGSIPDHLSPIYVHRSSSELTELVKKMLKESNNFIANQLLLGVAYHSHGAGSGIQEGVEIVHDFLKNRLNIGKDEIQLVEGSGLSMKNRVDLLAMLKVTNYFNDKKELLPSLSTSKYRDLARSGRKWKILAKSGTLSNIFTLAGFILTENHNWKPFVIMLQNGKREQRGTVMDLIGHYYNG